MTAADEGRPGGWVPTGPPATPPPAVPPASTAPPESPATPAAGADTRPMTRASIRAAREAEARRAEPAHGSAPGGGAAAAASPLTVVTAVALAVLVALSALVGSLPTALAVGFAAAVMVWGWARLTDAPSPRTASLVVGAGAVAICLTVVLTRTEPYLVWVPAAVAVSVVAAFLHQVFRGGGRPRLTDGVASSVAALAVTASGAALIPLPHDVRGSHWVAVAMAPVVVAAVLQPAAHRLGLGPWALLGTLVLGAGAAVLAAVLVTGIPLLGAVILGLLVSAVAHSLLRVLVALPGARAAQAGIAVGAASVLVVGVLAHLAARVYAA